MQESVNQGEGTPMADNRFSLIRLNPHTLQEKVPIVIHSSTMACLPEDMK